jgi:hypothetical protein
VYHAIDAAIRNDPTMPKVAKAVMISSIIHLSPNEFLSRDGNQQALCLLDWTDDRSQTAEECWKGKREVRAGSVTGGDPLRHVTSERERRCVVKLTWRLVALYRFWLPGL